MSTLKNLRVWELQAELKSRGANTSGIKADLQHRLTLFLVAEGKSPQTHVFGVPLAQQQPVIPAGQQAVSNRQDVNLLNASLLDILECPVCFHTALPPVFHCLNGHFICNACRPLNIECPTCRGPPPSVRSLALERMIDQLWLDCPNQGCTGRFHPADKLRHDANCPYRRH